MALVERFLAAQVDELMPEERALLIQGPRAVGKTTLLERIGAIHDRPIIDLADDLVRAVAAEDVRSYFSGLPRPILIDEYQRLPTVLNAVKHIVDHEEACGIFVLTGSTTADLLPRGTDSLAGRLHDFTLWGLSQGELAGQQEAFTDTAFLDPTSMRGQGHVTESRTDYVRISARGGFPEAVLREKEEAGARWLRSYASRVVERDLAEVVKLRHPAVLLQVMHSCMTRTAQVFNVSDVCNDLGQSKDIVSRYVDLLERVFVIERLPAYSRNRVTRLARHPKLHAVDTGLALAIAQMNSTALQRSPHFGAILESFVIGEIRKQLGWAKTPFRMFHFREHNHAEVDLVLESGDGRVVGIEVKSAAGVRRTDLRGLQRLAELTGPDFVHGFVLYTGGAGIQLGDDPRFSALPVSALWRTVAG